MMNLDQRRIDILNYLLDYRGMNAKQMTSFIYLNPNHTVSNLKQVQRELKSLEDNGYVTRFYYVEQIVDDEGAYKKQKVSMYYLTQKGYTVMLEYYNVLQGQRGSGFLLTNEFVYGDIPYDTYTPPKKLVEHHLMAINAFIQMSVAGKPVPHRNNLYAAKHFKNKRLRPDAEAVINDEIYFLEFDRYSENHEKLVEKFETYSDYFDTLNNEEIKKLGKIIFVVDGAGRDRRWNNILSAYLKGLNKYVRSVPLIMCETSELSWFLKNESDLKIINNDIVEKFLLKNSAIKRENIWLNKNINISFVIIENTIQMVTFLYQYDSTIFNRLDSIAYRAKKDKLKVNKTALIVSSNRVKDIKLNLEHYNVPQFYIDLYKFFMQMNKQVFLYQNLYFEEMNDDDCDY